MIKSISYSQDQIILWISNLYLKWKPFDLDCTVGMGNFYRKIPPAKIRSDIRETPAANLQSDFTALPFKDSSLKSIILDPPFLGSGGTHGNMTKKYGKFKRPEDVFEAYKKGIEECARVLKRYGHLVVKCQDSVYGRTQYFTHVEVMNYAVSVGLYPKDLFIGLAKTRPRAWNHKRNNHARKYHVYWWVFGRQHRSVPYSLGTRGNNHKPKGGK